MRLCGLCATLLLSLPAAACGQPPSSPSPAAPAAATDSAAAAAGPSASEEGQEGRLIRLLARARRIDPDGQELLREEAFLRRSIERFRLRIAELQADGEVQRGRELTNRRDVQDRLRAMRKMTPPDMERNYRLLLKEFQIDDLTLDAVSELQSLERRVGAMQEEIAQVQQQLDDRETGGPISLKGVTGSSDDQWEPPRPSRAANPKASRLPVDATMAEEVSKLLDRLIGEKKP